MLNLSLQTGYFANQWKEALLTPLLKKFGLEFSNNNLRPISILAYISKLVETAVADQLATHMTMNDLHPALQSSYRKYHSTETALLKVRNDILMNMNQQQVTLLVMLDLSAAFDTANLEILIKHLQSKIGFCGTPLEWFT
jgi:hypothetical protein